jgi:hypothetical protein
MSTAASGAVDRGGRARWSGRRSRPTAPGGRGSPRSRSPAGGKVHKMVHVPAAGLRPLEKPEAHRSVTRRVLSLDGQLREANRQPWHSETPPETVRLPGFHCCHSAFLFCCRIRFPFSFVACHCPPLGLHHLLRVMDDSISNDLGRVGWWLRAAGYLPRALPMNTWSHPMR